MRGGGDLRGDIVDINEDNSKKKTQRLLVNQLPPLEFDGIPQAEQGAGKLYSE